MSGNTNPLTKCHIPGDWLVSKNVVWTSSVSAFTGLCILIKYPLHGHVFVTCSLISLCLIISASNISAFVHFTGEACYKCCCLMSLWYLNLPHCIHVLSPCLCYFIIPFLGLYELTSFIFLLFSSFHRKANAVLHQFSVRFRCEAHLQCNVCIIILKCTSCGSCMNCK
jgi:hypothetical protein